MPVVKLAFDIDMNDLPAVLEAMRPYQKGIAFAVGLTGATFNQAALGENQLALDPDQTPEVGQPFNGNPPEAKARPRVAGRQPKLLGQALQLLRDAGAKGIAAGDFHKTMLESGLDRRASHNVLYNAKRKGFARQTPNKRIYITREGNART